MTRASRVIQAGPRCRLARWTWGLLACLVLPACGDGYEVPALAAIQPPSVRVLLGRKRDAGRLRIAAQSWAIAGGASYARRGEGAIDIRVEPGASGIRLGGEDTHAKDLRVHVAREFELDGTRYAGDLLLHQRDGRVRFVNEVDMETYVAGVIPNEMAPGAAPAAYHAQSVAARTYAWIRVSAANRDDKLFDVYDDQGSQVYTGLDPRYDVPYAAVRKYTAATVGVVLTWQNKPFPAYYSSTCGGHTTDARTSRLDPDGATVPLRGVKCDFCRTSPRFAWTAEVGEADIVKGLKARRLPIVAPVHAMRVTKQGAGGWAAEVEVTYGPARKTRLVPGTEFRSALRLDSHFIHGIEKRGTTWVLRGRGWGHGVGMCQWGALEMAKKGSTASEILSWYYPGAAFVRVY